MLGDPPVLAVVTLVDVVRHLPPGGLLLTTVEAPVWPFNRHSRFWVGLRTSLCNHKTPNMTWKCLLNSFPELAAVLDDVLSLLIILRRVVLHGFLFHREHLANRERLHFWNLIR